MSDVRCRIFDLCLSVPFPVSKEFRAPTGTPVDVYVKFGEVPRKLSNTVRQFSSEDVGIKMEVNDRNDILMHTATARYLVKDGCTVLITADSDSKAAMVRYTVLNYCLPALINQRGVDMALHGNAISTPRGGIVLAGVSGSGKSSLHAALLKRGMAMLSDDIAVLRSNAYSYDILPGIRRYRMTVEAWEQLRPPTERVVPLGGERNKVALWAPVNLMHDQPAPLMAIYILEPYDGIEILIEKLQGVAAFRLLQTQAYLPLGSMVLFKDMYSFSKLVDSVSIYQVRRPANRWTVDELASLVLEVDPLSCLPTYG
ncbi:MAG: hypothetical protein H6642_15665 [Caldilineaceae bacterium]|nr:hypothetical protein [Caldilineaceae bacterium]